MIELVFWSKFERGRGEEWGYIGSQVYAVQRVWLRFWLSWSLYRMSFSREPGNSPLRRISRSAPGPKRRFIGRTYLRSDANKSVCLRRREKGYCNKWLILTDASKMKNTHQFIYFPCSYQLYQATRLQCFCMFCVIIYRLWFCNSLIMISKWLAVHSWTGENKPQHITPLKE